MTRINVIDPIELTDKHLVAEYREIARLPGYLKKSMVAGKVVVPQSYVLGTGHVKFFYDKMLYLEKRFMGLVQEMHRRGFNTNFQDPNIFRVFGSEYYNDWVPDENALRLNRKRINDRLSGVKD